MIVDVHAHLGWDHQFEHDFSEVELLHGAFDNGIAPVDLTLVQPGTCFDLETVQRQHDAVAGLCRRYPGRFAGMANPNPHLPEAIYRAEVERCVRQLGFVGIKCHTLAHAINPASACGRRIWETAADLDVPVMVHTGTGGAFALPLATVPAALSFPGVKTVLAHSGMMCFAAEALQAARLCDNVYLETTWTAGFLVRRWAELLGRQRLLFGSDHGDNCATELTKVRTSGLPPEDQAWVLGRTAQAVYRLETHGAHAPA
jgi:predicted TIM-barrel fold metal-dependent hydrolase